MERFRDFVKECENLKLKTKNQEKKKTRESREPHLLKILLSDLIYIWLSFLFFFNLMVTLLLNQGKTHSSDRPI